MTLSNDDSGRFSSVFREDGIEYGFIGRLLCFLQPFSASSRDSTWYFANNNARHFTLNAEERFLPICKFADEKNEKISQLHDFADQFLLKCTLGQTIPLAA